MSLATGPFPDCRVLGLFSVVAVQTMAARMEMWEVGSRER